MTAFPKRVAVICFSRSFGGLELSTLRLARTMNGKGVPAMVVVPSNSSLHKKAQEWGIESSTLAPAWKYGDVLAARRLARILTEHRIDVAILMQSHDIHLASIATKFSPHVKLAFYQQMDSRHNKKDLLHSWAFSKLSLWITLTERMKENALASTRMPSEKVHVVPLGTDLQRFDPALYSRADSRSAFNLPAEKKIIGVLGRIDPGKGQEIIVRALPDLMKQHPDLFLVIAGEETAGEPGHKAYLQKLCLTLGIEQHVKFIPFTDDVPRLLAALDIFALPSFGETFGLVVIEAMAMEKAVIATDAGGVPEIVEHGRTGLLIEPRSVSSAATAIDKLLRDESLRISLGISARKEALLRFSMDHCVNMLLGLLSNI
ncbi:MAG TPA: glycosyltransferase family 4 protein [Bacteroidota bacterium]|nr:glycosyltransferase family 4 protein [Bacteroidota bacterium]